jgi:hypothetical protein
MPAYPENRPSWLPAKDPSVFDSYRDRIVRVLGGLVGADDPAGSMMGVASPLAVTAFKGMYPRDAAGQLINEFRSAGVKAAGAFENYVGKKGGFAGFFSDSPEVASRFGPAVYPVEIQDFTRPLVIDAKGSRAASMQFADLAQQPHEKQGLMEMWDTLRGQNSGGYDGVILRNTSDEGTVYIPLNPAQVRSRFAPK